MSQLLLLLLLSKDRWHNLLYHPFLFYDRQLCVKRMRTDSITLRKERKKKWNKEDTWIDIGHHLTKIYLHYKIKLIRQVVVIVPMLVVITVVFLLLLSILTISFACVRFHWTEQISRMTTSYNVCNLWMFRCMSVTNEDR